MFRIVHVSGNYAGSCVGLYNPNLPMWPYTLENQRHGTFLKKKGSDNNKYMKMQTDLANAERIAFQRV